MLAHEVERHEALVRESKAFEAANAELADAKRVGSALHIYSRHSVCGERACVRVC